jgi:hypothetical protein
MEVFKTMKFCIKKSPLKVKKDCGWYNTYNQYGTNVTWFLGDVNRKISVFVSGFPPNESRECNNAERPDETEPQS